MLICFISNRAELLQENLPSYFDKARELNEQVTFLIINDAASFEKNKPFLDEYRQKTSTCIIHICENTARNFAKEVGADLFFSGKYGGNRNIGLVFSSLLHENILFFDDDTAPLPNTLKKFRTGFQSNAPVIQGGYLGNVGGSIKLLFELVSTLQNKSNQNTDNTELRQRLFNILRGLSDFVDDPQKVQELFLGGSLGIANEISQKYCFFPTSYRVEDALYIRFFPYVFTDKELPVFSKEQIPFVFHKRASKSISTLRSDLVNEIEGTQIGAAIDYLVRAGYSLHLENNFAEAQVQLAMNAGRKAIHQLFPIDFVLSGLEKEKLESRLVSPDDDQVRKELYLLLDICRNPPLLPKTDLVSEIEKFFFCERNWEIFVTALSNSDFIKNITKKNGL
ncbi:MAG: hypothetical protein NTY90_02715 [Candidatus Micrarchaeota archaeon]|nr:hypothetical protein [Candidatus Micrarchaeota archaeon]